MTQSTIGSYIRSCRLHKGLTQKALADRLHITDKAVSKWERDLSYPDIQLLPKLAEVLGVTVGELISQFGDEAEKQEFLLSQYALSSDLRTPLHIILGCAELVMAYRFDNEKFEHYLDAIRVSGRYLLSALEGFNQNHEERLNELDNMIREHGTDLPDFKTVYDFSGKRVLIAEDMQINREIAREILKPTGAELEFAEDGLECVEKVDRNPPGYYDMILMDIVMPNLDGLEAAKRIRTLDGKEGIPIVAMTANVEEKDRDAAFKAGMDAFAGKPIFADQLFETMKRLF